MRILIAGINSVVGSRVTERHQHLGPRVVGIDSRPWPDPPENVEVHAHDIRKRDAEEVFRVYRPEVVVHMATVTHLERSSQERYRINLHGTRAVFDRCARYGARRAVFVGRHTYYGAGPDSPLYHKEDSPPMATATFPELADLVAADLYATTALWRLPDLETVILRMTYQLGPTRAATLASFLRGPRVPMVMGFDPLFHFMHEEDMAAAITLAVTGDARGVFNVAGPTPIPLSILIRETGRQAVPMPEPLLARLMGRFGFPRLPRAALEHVKYPVVVDDGAFRATTGFAPEFGLTETLASFAAEAP